MMVTTTTTSAIVAALLVIMSCCCTSSSAAVAGGRPANLLHHLPGHERHDLSQPPPHPRRQQPTTGSAAPDCPAGVAAAAMATGMVSLESFLNKTAGADDAVAVRAALAAAQNCSAALFLPPGRYSFQTTVVLPGNMEVRGSGLQPSEFLPPPGAWVYGPKNGPAFLIAHVESVHLADLNIVGTYTGVIVTDSALIKFSNVGIQAQFAGLAENERPCTIPDSEGNGGCNVAMGSNNTALVIENSFVRVATFVAP
jgi:hypothetical protein